MRKQVEVAKRGGAGSGGGTGKPSTKQREAAASLRTKMNSAVFAEQERIEKKSVETKIPERVKGCWC